MGILADQRTALQEIYDEGSEIEPLYARIQQTPETAELAATQFNNHFAHRMRDAIRAIPPPFSEAVVQAFDASKTDPTVIEIRPTIDDDVRKGLEKIGIVKPSTRLVEIIAWHMRRILRLGVLLNDPVWESQPDGGGDNVLADDSQEGDPASVWS